jgi:hypothetical protein
MASKRIRTVEIPNRGTVKIALRNLANGRVRASFVDHPQRYFVAESESAVLALLVRWSSDCQPMPGVHLR